MFMYRNPLRSNIVFMHGRRSDILRQLSFEIGAIYFLDLDLAL